MKRGIGLAGIVTAAALNSLVASASAADLRPVYKAPPVPVFTWTGVYIGAHVGYGWGDSSASPTGIVGLLVNPFDVSHDGFLAGGTLGVNYQSGNIVLGVEGEWSWTNIDGSNNSTILFGLIPGATLNGTYSNNWIANISGRIGVAFDTVLVYGKAGIAWANNDYSVTATIPGALNYASTISETETGWLVGLGVEWAFARNWSMKIEGNYMDFGQKNRTFAGIPIGGGFALPVNSDIDSHIGTIKVGINYRFY
jgi:outer membrane immunogenic protein